MTRYARRKMIAEAGGLWFVGSLTPHDPASGRLIGGEDELPEVLRPVRAGLMFFDIPERAAMAQTWALYQALERLLRERTLTLRHVVRQRLLISDLRDLPAIERVMDIALGDWRPATTVIVMAAGKVHPALRVQLDAIAATDSAAIDVIPAPGERYPAAVTAGPFVFTSGITGLTGSGGGARASNTDLDLIRTPAEREIYAQSLQTFANLEAILARADAGIPDLLKVNGWVDLPMREYGAVVLARRRFFDQTKENMMASTGLAVGGTGCPGARVAFDAIALAPGRGAAPKEVSGLASPIASPYVAGAVQAGGLVFTSGEIPVIMPDGKVMSACELLPAEGKLLRAGQVEPECGIEPRAWYVYRTLGAYLERFGAGFEHVVHQTVFMEHPHEYPVLERIATLYFGVTLPPTTLVPIADTTPFRPAELEIELVAHSRQ